MNRSHLQPPQRTMRGLAVKLLAAACLLTAPLASRPAAAQAPPAPPAAQAQAPAPPAEGRGGADSDLAAESKDAGETVAEEGSGTGRTLQERIRAVSRRVFLKRGRFELEPQFGFTANDALNRAWSFGARGSYHFNEEFALDFGGGGGFSQQLDDVRLFDADPEALNEARAGTPKQYGYADVGVTFSPFYGKLALMAEQVIHFDGFISGGLGAVIDDSAEAVHPAIELGVGGRVFVSRWLCIRADVRNYTYPLTVARELTFPSALILSFGVGVFLPFDFDYSNEIIGGKT